MNKIVRRSSVRFVSALVALALVSLGPLAFADETSPPDLTGRWVMVQRLATYAVLPIINEIYLTTTIALFSDVTQADTSVTLQDAYCFTNLEVSTALFVTEIPDEVMQSLQPEPRTAEWVNDNGTYRLTQAWHTEIRGAVLDDPVNDPLPISPSDPRLVDQEGDGKLGITIPANLNNQLTGEIYATQRFRYRLEGDVVDENTIVGLVEWTTEQTVVSATDAMFFMPFTQTTDPDPRQHRFVMVRVDETWDCETLREELDALLALLPPLPEPEPETDVQASEKPAVP